MSPSDVALALQTLSKRQATQKSILELLSAYGPADDQTLQARYEELLLTRTDLKRRSPSSLRTARHELVNRHLVRDSGTASESAYGLPCTVWALAAS